MSRPDYPLLLDVNGRRTVVVGGGPVAARRVTALVDSGADVEVVAPYVCEPLWELAEAGRITIRLREYAPGDLDAAWLVHTASGDPHVDAAVADEAQAGRMWCVHAGDADLATAWTPAVARVGEVVVAVSAGADPRRARALRDAVSLCLADGSLPLRRCRPGPGHVALVGGGPGDASLITVRGRHLLAQADVVVVDRLAPRDLLEELADDVEVVEAGKAPHAHTLTQDQINDVLIDRARAGLRAVRLKGGDPFVLGRGGEEALACLAAGVEVEVVPGITSAVAVPASAGIPLTHRGVSSRFTVVSGHEGPIDWSSLVGAGQTLVFLMGVRRLGEIADQLVAHGSPPHTAVAVVERGTTPDQRTTVGTLETIASRCHELGVASPAVVVVGEVVGLQTHLAAVGAANKVGA
ncbi:MAG: uroporphyrinogen-III C-methyltransferase [Actinomycetes bacterium]